MKYNEIDIESIVDEHGNQFSSHVLKEFSQRCQGTPKDAKLSFDVFSLTF